MNYSFDIYGWLIDQQIAGRETEVEPPAHGAKLSGEPYPNWNGKAWILVPYVEINPSPAAEPEPTPSPVVYETRLTKLEFMRRFTMNELDAIYEATESGTPETRRLRIGLEMLRMAEYVRTEDVATLDFINGITTAGLITAERAAEILA